MSEPKKREPREGPTRFGDIGLEFVTIRGPNGEPIEEERTDAREIPGQGEEE